MYYNPKITKDELFERLRKFDEEYFLDAFQKDDKERLIIVIVGSACLILNNINIPATQDIDIIKNSKKIDGYLFEKYDMNTRAKGLENFLPYNYEDRLIKFNFDTKIVDYYFLSLEDIVVAKIVAAREKDDDHLKADDIAKNIHWPTLKKCMEEVKLSLLNENDYFWMVNRYNDFVRRNNHEEVVIENI